MFEYTTYEQAMQAFEDACEDARSDNPDVGDDDIAHDIGVYSIAPLCSPEVRAEFLRCQIGWDPEHDANLFAQLGL